jgi:hypothetical protein
MARNLYDFACICGHILLTLARITTRSLPPTSTRCLGTSPPEPSMSADIRQDRPSCNIPKKESVVKHSKITTSAYLRHAHVCGLHQQLLASNVEEGQNNLHVPVGARCVKARPAILHTGKPEKNAG